MDYDAIVVGGGPAGLMAAEVLADEGHSVLVVEAKPSLGRKFLMAGKSGLNLTKDVDAEALTEAFGGSVDLSAALARFGVTEVCAWAENLGQEIFVGSSGRVFPKVMKASPLLRAWLKRLERKGVAVQTRTRLISLEPLTFETPEGALEGRAKAVVLALGGASWARLGSDGAWAEGLMSDVDLAPFGPVNVGLEVAWSEHMAPFFGTPLKSVVFHAGDLRVAAEAVISARGLEGGGIYEVSKPVVQGAALTVDLMPDWSEEKLRATLTKRGKQSWGSFLRKALRWGPLKQTLFMELARPVPSDPVALIKALPIPVTGPAAMDGAISTSGGVPAPALDGFMLRAKPGVFCAGEMLDWDAPTGGYLITGCLASGLVAGEAAARWISAAPS